MKIWILLFLIMAAIYDYRDFKIPNKLNGTGALITLVLAGVSGMKAADMMILSLIHISEPTRRTPISYAVFCLKKKIDTISN